jgi:hypothetical protein
LETSEVDVTILSQASAAELDTLIASILPTGIATPPRTSVIFIRIWWWTARRAGRLEALRKVTVVDPRRQTSLLFG